jgi:exodeoxyribonuclease VII large subunit
VWGVAALLVATRDAIAARFASVAVRGELSGFTRAASGHCYFTLKDASGASALIRCAMFRRAATLLDFAAADGQQVDVHGRLGIFEPRGELQLVVEAMRRVGTGSLYEEFLRLRARLEQQGLFDATRKREISREPRAVGVVTSLGAAALHDVLTALQRRAPHLHVVVYPCLVQGAEAPAAVVAALALANERSEVQTLLLVRGGGSLEDLWAFNDERVVRAVATSALPVVCGVGHETDITLADLAADLRAPTPTAAAELAAPARDEALASLAARGGALSAALSRSLMTQAQRIDRIALRFGAPAAMLATQQERLLSAQRRLRVAVKQAWPQQRATLNLQHERLQRAMAAWQQQQQRQWQARQGRLQALDPTRVLQRGYAWIEDSSGRAVVSARTLAPGQTLQAVWSDGRAVATVQSVEPREPQG